MVTIRRIKKIWIKQFCGHPACYRNQFVWALNIVLVFVIIPIISTVLADEDFLVVRGVGRFTLISGVAITSLVFGGAAALVVWLLRIISPKFPTLGVLVSLLVYGAIKPTTPFALMGV